jgi:hypothetical protein
METLEQSLETVEKRVDGWELPWRLYGVRCAGLLRQETVKKFFLRDTFYTKEPN